MPFNSSSARDTGVRLTPSRAAISPSFNISPGAYLSVIIARCRIVNSVSYRNAKGSLRCCASNAHFNSSAFTSFLLFHFCLICFYKKTAAEKNYKIYTIKSPIFLKQSNTSYKYAERYCFFRQKSPAFFIICSVSFQLSLYTYFSGNTTQKEASAWERS